MEVDVIFVEIRGALQEDFLPNGDIQAIGAKYCPPEIAQPIP
jgi:hypothetical protein